MKCPLQLTIKVYEDNTTMERLGDCLKEECAWWRKSIEMCAIPDITYRLAEIQARLEAQERNELWRVKK